MATPFNGNQMAAPVASPNLYNQVSSLGMSPENPNEKPTNDVSPAEKLINGFGTIINDIQTFTSQYPNASAEYNEVVKALKNWLAKASDGISSGNTGESTGAATPY
jgi:hypothetical protein